MLTTLRIKNLALVDDLTLEPLPGYNVITGETGAGKSIILGALKLLLGERADRTMIRAGCETCTVEAVFDTRTLDRSLPRLLEESGLEPCEDQQLILKRVLTVSGGNRQFVNGTPTSLATLAALGEGLVDIHGPHDHQSLLHTSRQLDLLDAHAGLTAERESFAKLVQQRAQALAQKAALIVDEQSYAQQLDLLRFQVKEITSARLDPQEEDQVEAEHRRAANSARLLELGHAARDGMVEDEAALLTQAGGVARHIQELARLDPAATPLLQQLEQALEALRDLVRNLSSYLDAIDVDPARLRELEERLNLIQSLKRKYGPDLERVIAFGEQAVARLNCLERQDEELARLNQELDRLEKVLRTAGKHLSAQRRQAIPKFRKEVTRQLEALGFPSSLLDIALESTLPPADVALGDVKSSGFDQAEFLFAPNPGEPARPLRAIASSGELARVMLALKTVLAVEDKIPVLVFDEVDANVGGQTARVVGGKMQEIAGRRQVFCITHLPQVAAPAATHFVVSKAIQEGRTLSRIVRVSGEARVRELSRMLGGSTHAAQAHAKAMLAS
ncbi:MAG: DNA repair protein RecN [Verrucomicrobia bacterium]|jgi:DNA repair protein RecN (Recombination protein N)|nr:DNA repair protein RecN [Verrucomicrobiota bacterium]